MGDTPAHVAEWQAAGLIDAATADRIRAFDSSTSSTGAGPRESAFAAMFGPSLTIGEVFSYLGAFFVLAASDAFLAKLSGPAPSSEWSLVAGTALQTVVLLAIGFRLRTGDRRRSRAAGLMFLTATVHAGVTGGLAAGAIGLEWPLSGIVGAVAALVVGVGTRIVHPGLLTQAAVLGAVTSLAGTTLAWLQQIFFPQPDFSTLDPVVAAGPGPFVEVLGQAAWWLATALVIGLIGLREAARADEDPGASRRAGVSRFWAGMVAVVGFTSAVTQYALRWRMGSTAGSSNRGSPTWRSCVLALILIQRAFRRDDSAFVYPAALAMIIALTDFNVSYLGGATEVGLLVEGLILLAVGFGAQRIRRMVGGSGGSPGDRLAGPSSIGRSRRPPSRSARSSRSPPARRVPPSARTDRGGTGGASPAPRRRPCARP